MFAELCLAVLLVSGGPAIDGVYPDPATGEDRGEFVVVAVPDRENVTYALTDGEDRIELPSLPAGERVVVTADDGPASRLVDTRIHEIERFLSLSNAGEWVALEAGNETVANVSYPASSEGELYRDGRFVPPGRTAFEPTARENVSVRAALLPDTPEPIRETIRSAEERILLAGYTFSDPAIADALIAARDRNVSVQVLVDGAPVGGMERPQVRQLDRLREAGVRVAAVGTEHARYRYHHAKYAVVDDRAVVTSENWEPGSTGGNGSRGWVATIDDPRIAHDLARIFEADLGYVDTRNWTAARPEETVDGDLATADFPRRFDPRRTRAATVTVLSAPDNAERAVCRLLANASDSIRVQQVSIDPAGKPFNRTLAAARRGVEVDVLLSGAWYVEEENRALAARLRNVSDREDLDLQVALAEPRSRYDHVHTKGLLVDGEYTLVGSLNWNPTAMRENREVALLIQDESVARYFQRAFRADWRGAAWRLSWGTLAGAVIVLAIGVLLAARMLDFEGY